MNYYLSIILGIVLISSISVSAGTPEQKRELKSKGEAGAMIGAPAALHLRIVPNGFQLDWTVSSGDPGVVTGYEIVRADRFSGPYEPVATVEQGTSRYIDTTAMPEIIFF
ncbi:MAG: hypothetical protein ACYC7L_14505 [Nitrospirota bacterium]